MSDMTANPFHVTNPTRAKRTVMSVPRSSLGYTPAYDSFAATPGSPGAYALPRRSVLMDIPRMIREGFIDSSLALHYPLAIGVAAFRGAISEIYIQAKEWIVGLPVQLAQDIKHIIAAVRAARGNRLRFGAQRRQFAVRIGIALWAVPFTAYQFLDDLPGLYFYQQIQQAANSLTAYGVIAAATFVLAMAVGMMQRYVHKKRAQINGVVIVRDQTPFGPALAESTMSSSGWQVHKAANGVGADDISTSDWTVRTPQVALTSAGRITAYSAAYAVVNTALYQAGSTIPFVNTWAGFVIALMCLWFVLGARKAIGAKLADLRHAPHHPNTMETVR